MDSFYGSVAPCPVKKPVLEFAVPDVSLLVNAPSNSNGANTYRDWRNNFQNKEPWTKTNASILKKQVRFNSPTAQQNSGDQVQVNMIRSNENNQNVNTSENLDLESKCFTPPMNKVFKNKQFQDVYMANIPNRHLDLSLIDVVKPIPNPQNSNDNKKNSSLNTIPKHEIHCSPTPRAPTTYKEFLKLQQCESDSSNLRENAIVAEECITDIFNYTSPRNRSANKLPSKNVLRTYSEATKSVLTPKQTHMKRNPMNNINMNNQSHIFNVSGKHSDLNANNLQRIMNQQQGNIGDENSPPKQVHMSDRDYQSPNNNQIVSKSGPLVKSGEKCNSAVQTSIICSRNIDKDDAKENYSKELAKNDEPTVKDLLKIIQQQNEQLLILQKQVSNLLECRDGPKQIETLESNMNLNKDKFITNGEQREILNSAGSTPRRGTLPKFSIDLMTSFEVSFRPQQNMYQRKQRDHISHEPKIQEITETESNDSDYGKESRKKINDTSLQLQDQISVQETCPSPEPSIRIDMKDYESSDEEDDDVTSRIGATFYKNLMDQVNKIILNAQKQTTSDSRSSRTDELRDKTLSRVKDATIKQLRKIGMNFSTIEEVSTSNCSNISDDSTSDQISFAVKQLLMKYLPDDQLAKLTTKTQTAPKRHTEDKIILNSRGPEFSFATVQFMRKYNLIAGDGNHVPQKTTVPAKAKPPKMCQRPNESNRKILDISALKQQPKLL